MNYKERFIALILLALVTLLLILIAWVKQYLKDQQPIYEVKATLVDKRPESHAIRGRYAQTSNCYYVVKFRLEDGTLVELNAPGEFREFDVGTSGIVIFQGEKCEKFTPEA